MNASGADCEVVYAATSVAELEPPREPEPATSAPGGTGNWLGQFGGSLPSRERDTWPLGVETWKFLAVRPGSDWRSRGRSGASRGRTRRR